ncbi:SpoVK/Ycf46/Vps4 family AAA+-type ATPase [Natranaerovirga hydrolytica]|uniref:SpoVK/Ycf46/Vps4 family AAA+-type ATPase n=1 Tax=Natranaerovirga hydrolytica TaxID=680378 RepID=A0A4R1MYV5_9FIRM|nr:AAA family ATPase [Natranaerovirga hydrolytica]TCK98498.1 SpoVK/Ycf46/Vps4 family AAA+-type ATPase [Natranaerovirga hydrolytica]
MKEEAIKEKLNHIKDKLNDDLVGQEDFVQQLTNYMYEKLLENKKGTLLLKGEGGTFKKQSIRLLIKLLEENELINPGGLDEIDLSSYNFNLGYDAFLTDLYEKLNSHSSAVLFKNIEKANEKILALLTKLYPDTCLMLNNEYVYKNKFLVEADHHNTSHNKINQFVCHNKFFIFTYNYQKEEKDKMDMEEIFTNTDKTLHTKSLTDQEKYLVMKKEVFKALDTIQESLGMNILWGKEDNRSEEADGELFVYLRENFMESAYFDVKEYISYKLYKPVINFITKENIKEKEKVLLYIEENEICCKYNNAVYNLSEYLIPTLEEAKYKLNSVIGMKGLKEFIVNVENNYKVQKIREKLGLPTSYMSLNMIFTGNAGTGKTNAARITFEYLNALDILSKSIFKEVSKADFSTENVKDTAKRTQEIVKSAIGGVLFIDEAYSLCEDDNDFIGKEIVNALLKEIEDNRENLIVILAGYEKDMDRFLKINQGLKSRFSNTIRFEDYTPMEMYGIAVNIAKSKGYKIDKRVKTDLIDLFAKNQFIGKTDLGNARFVRNIVENAIMDASKKYLEGVNKQIDLLERDNFNFKVKAKFDLEEKLKAIIGLEEVKKLLRSQYQLIVAQEKRKSVGVKTKLEQNLNMVFSGNPGTGKTSIARLVAEMLNSMGLLKVGQLIETDRSHFVADTVSETAKKTETKFKEAIGGILFIDEAYTLANDTLGKEAVEILLKLIEDYSNEVIVILAGYEQEMEDFFDINAGLRSRFPLWTNFEDYNPDELLEIAIKIIEGNGFKLSKNAYRALQKSFVDLYENADSKSGNGRMVRNYVENLIRNQSIRIAKENISVYEMNLITSSDIETMNLAEYDNNFNVDEKLEYIVGNTQAKTFLKNQYKLLKIKEKRKRLGIGTDLNRYNHMVFTGEKGTGKKTILNIYAEMLYCMGIIKSKKIIELDKRELIDHIKKQKCITELLNKCLGKVVFIEHWDVFIDAEIEGKLTSGLIKFIDESKNRIHIILSGHKDNMTSMVLLDSALSYRLPIWVDFNNYNKEELYKIALNLLGEKGYLLEEKDKATLETVIRDIANTSGLQLKNGLLVEQYLDYLLREQSVRIWDEKVSDNELNVITKEDINNSKTSFLKKNVQV